MLPGSLPNLLLLGSILLGSLLTALAPRSVDVAVTRQHLPFVAAANLPAAPSPTHLPPTGFYGHNLVLVRAADGSLVGSFNEGAGVQPKFSCGFLLRSTGAPKSDGTVPIVTWWPDRELNGGKDDEVVLGKLLLHDATVSLQLPKQAHGGCWNVEPELDHGDVFEVGTGAAHPAWQGIRVVSSDKLAFHHRPDANDFTKAYVLRGDTLLLLDTEAQDGVWRHVQLVNQDGVRGVGWVLESGLLPWSVPTH